MRGCADGGNIYLSPDGSYREIGGCTGRWWRSGGAVHLGGTCPLSILTADPLPIMGHDEDGVLPFVSPGVIEARARGVAKQVRRCS